MYGIMICSNQNPLVTAIFVTNFILFCSIFIFVKEPVYNLASNREFVMG